MTMLRPYPAYKSSGVDWLGGIPEHWRIVRLKSLGSMQIGEGITSEQIEEVGTYPVYGGNGQRGFSEQFTHDGDFVMVGQQGALCGNVHRTSGRFWASEHAIVVTPKARTDANWLSRLLEVMDLNQYSISAAQPGLAVERLVHLRATLPPLDEQRAIAAFLDAMDDRVTRFIAARRRMIALLEEQKQAIITQVVTKGLNPDVPMKPSGIDWLGDIPAHWEVRRFKHVARINSGQIDPRQDAYKSEVLIAPNHIAKDTGQLLDLETASDQGADSGKYMVQKGQVIYSKIRPYLRKAAIAPFDCLCSADMYPITPDSSRMNTDFFLRALLSPSATRYIVDASLRARMPKVNREALGELWLAYPSLNEQQLIVDYIERETLLTNETIMRNEREIYLIQEYRTRLISDVVTGKLDVSELETPTVKDIQRGWDTRRTPEKITLQNEMSKKRLTQ